MNNGAQGKRWSHDEVNEDLLGQLQCTRTNKAAEAKDSQIRLEVIAVAALKHLPHTYTHFISLVYPEDTSRIISKHAKRKQKQDICEIN